MGESGEDIFDGVLVEEIEGTLEGLLCRRAWTTAGQGVRLLFPPAPRPLASNCAACHRMWMSADVAVAALPGDIQAGVGVAAAVEQIALVFALFALGFSTASSSHVLCVSPAPPAFSCGVIFVDRHQLS